MRARGVLLALSIAVLSAWSGCGGPAGPDEVTTTVTEGDEEAWSSPGDPPRQDDAAGTDADDDGEDDGDFDE